MKMSMRQDQLTLQASSWLYSKTIKTVAMLLAWITLCFTTTVNAHESNPSVAVLQFEPDHTLNITLSTNLEALMTGIGPDHDVSDFSKSARYTKLRKLPAAELETLFNEFSASLIQGLQLTVDGKAQTVTVVDKHIPSATPEKTRTSVITLRAMLPETANILQWQWHKDFGIVALRLHSPERQDVYNAYLEPAVKSEAFALSKLTQSKPTMGEYLGAKPTEYPDWFKDSFLEFKDDIAEAAEQGKRLAIVFHQDNCPYCNLLVERNLSQHDIAQHMKDQFDVVAINMWGARELVSVGGKHYTERDFAAALKVQYTPTILFFNETGKLALRLNGYLHPPEFKRALEYVSQKMESKQSYTDYIAANRVESANQSLNSAAFFTAPPYDLSATIANSSQPIAVFFEQQNCPNCDTLHKAVLSDPDTRTIVQQFHNVQLDMWSDTPIVTPTGEATSAKQWAKQLGVNYAPSILLFDQHGKEIIRIEAMFKAFHTQSAFDYVLTESYQTEPSFQRFISHRAEVIRETGKDVDLWK